MALSLQTSPGRALVQARPFVKWVGGKRQLLPHIQTLLPEDFGVYFEPFAGGGAVFFALEPERAVLGDRNGELINAYRMIKSEVEALIRVLKKHYYESDYFYEMRALDTSSLSPLERAARFIYLNRTCFNGLYRVNKKGEFNVPFGRYKDPLICDDSNLRSVAARLKRVKLMNHDYNRVLRTAAEGDFVYFDPPYEPLSASSNFTAYTNQGFSSDDQKALAELFAELTEKGVFCMLSNSSAPLIYELYKDFTMHEVLANRAVNSRADKRGKVKELLVTNY